MTDLLPYQEIKLRARFLVGFRSTQKSGSSISGSKKKKGKIVNRRSDSVQPRKIMYMANAYRGKTRMVTEAELEDILAARVKED